MKGVPNIPVLVLSSQFTVHPSRDQHVTVQPSLSKLSRHAALDSEQPTIRSLVKKTNRRLLVGHNVVTNRGSTIGFVFLVGQMNDPKGNVWSEANK